MCAFNQKYISKICSDALEIVSEELKFEGDIYNSIEIYLKKKNDHLKIIKNEYGSKTAFLFNLYLYNYRDIDEKDLNNHINKKLGELPIHQLLKPLSLDGLKRSFDANSLYASAMSDEKSINPRMKTGYALTPDMNYEIVKSFNTQTLNQRGATLKIKYFNPENLIVQHIPIKER